MFDLFRLHDSKKDKLPRNWIKLGGKGVIKEVNKITLSILKESNLKNIIYNIAQKLNVNTIIIKDYINKIKQESYFIPIPIIKEIIKIYSSRNYEEIKWKIINLTKEIKCYSVASKSTKIPKELTNDLITLCGIYAADGTLSKITNLYRFEITEGSKDSCKIVIKLIKKIFNIDLPIKKSKHGNYHSIILSNKPIFRFLTKILKFKPGNKITTIKIPNIIKKLDLEKQKLFVKGFLTFDGSVDIYGYIRLSIKNKCLLKEIINILEKDNIKVKLEKERKRKGVYSFRILIPKDKKFLDYLIKGTSKYKRAEFFIKSKTNTNIFNLFNEKPHSKTSLNKILNLAKELKMFTISKIRDLSKLSDRTLRTYLRILIIAGFIKEIKKKSKFNININSTKGFDNTTAIKLNNNFRINLFNNLLDNHKIYEIANKLKTNSPTVTNWKLGHNRINKNYLIKLLNLSNFKENNLYNSIENINKNFYVSNL